MRKKSIGWILVIILIGAFIGTALGEILAYILPEGVVKEFFLRAATFSLGPGTLNLVILTLTFGFSFKINVVSIIGIIIIAYFLRWVE